MNEGVRELAANCLRADRVVLGVLPSLGPPLVEQRFAYVGEDGKRVEALAQAIREGFARPPCLVFARVAAASAIRRYTSRRMSAMQQRRGNAAASKRGSGGPPSSEKKRSGAPPPAADAMEDSDLEFEDEAEDEFIVEDEAMGGDDEEMDEDAVRAAVAADGREQETQLSWDPRKNVEGEGDLECDPRAYKMLHRLGSDWPCLSFDLVPDGGGGGRTRFPHDLLGATGTQAGPGEANKLTFLKLEGLGRMEVEDSDASDDDDDDDEARPATAEHVAFAQPGVARRVACSKPSPGLVATWSDDATVRLWDARDECAALCAPHRSGPGRGAQSRDPPAARRAAPGYALQWSPLEPSRLACGGDDGGVAVLDAALDGAAPRRRQRWACPGAVEDVAFSPTEPTVLMACGAASAALRVFDARHGDRPMLALDGAHGADDVNAMSWNGAVAYLVATGGDDGVARVWDLRAFGKDAKPVGLFDYHKGGHVCSVAWDPHDDGASEFGVPPQLMFVHQGLRDPKEVKYHPQIPGLCMTTALDGFNVFIPNL
ncbi:hypothetical protein JL721_13101 [Aureococcus anophagefferens]|nr:hypothetical protein JL721_13101 [Aureococcus anophagefferens]